MEEEKRKSEEDLVLWNNFKDEIISKYYLMNYI